MKIINNKYFKILAAVSIAAVLTFSCSDKKQKSSDATAEVQADEEPQRPHWQPTAEKICVVFGYGYNSEEFVKAEISHLEDFYGLSDGTENSGMIIPYVFPDDLKVGNTGRISRLVALLKDVNIAGLITVGAPEYTSNTLSQFRDKMELPAKPSDETEKSDKEQTDEKIKPFPIYTLFPQDDILAIEATSDFVLDKAVEQSDKVEEIKEETEQVKVNGIEDIIDNAIDYMVLTKKPLKSDAKLSDHVSKIAGKNYKIKRYIDPETGLSSINHFIIEEIKKEETVTQ